MVLRPHRVEEDAAHVQWLRQEPVACVDQERRRRRDARHVEADHAVVGDVHRPADQPKEQRAEHTHDRTPRADGEHAAEGVEDREVHHEQRHGEPVGAIPDAGGNAHREPRSRHEQYGLQRDEEYHANVLSGEDRPARRGLRQQHRDGVRFQERRQESRGPEQRQQHARGIGEDASQPKLDQLDRVGSAL